MTASELPLLRMAFMQAWNAIVITDADPSGGYRVEIANPAFTRMTGYSLEELQGRSLKMLQGPDTDPAVIERLRACLKEGRYFEGMTANYRKDGSSYLVRWSISPVRDDHGNMTHFVSVQQDLSDYVRAEQRNHLLVRALDATSDPVLLTDEQARIVFVNAAFAKVTGFGAEEVLGKTPALLHSGQQDEAFYQQLRKTLSSGQDLRATFVNKKRDGSLYHSEQSISPISDEQGRITHYVSVSRDITHRVKVEQALMQAATQDRLTRLHNRHHGEFLLSEAYLKALKHHSGLSVIMCDIDHFKHINDSFGHPVGDRVLGSVARTIRHAVRNSDPVVRWGGEEFLILLSDCSQDAAQELAERIRLRVQELRDAEAGQVTLSLGLATFNHIESLDRLIARCDAALYTSKHSGRNRVSAAPAPD